MWLCSDGLAGRGQQLMFVLRKASWAGIGVPGTASSAGQVGCGHGLLCRTGWVWTPVRLLASHRARVPEDTERPTAFSDQASESRGSISAALRWGSAVSSQVLGKGH